MLIIKKARSVQVTKSTHDIHKALIHNSHSSPMCPRPKKYK